jgi:hypothetical protein
MSFWLVSSNGLAVSGPAISDQVDTSDSFAASLKLISSIQGSLSANTKTQDRIAESEMISQTDDLPFSLDLAYGSFLSFSFKAKDIVAVSDES